jgi:putative heme-binding domain-containing protein
MKAMRRFVYILSLALCGPLTAAPFQIGAHNFTLPAGFEIELVAGTNLVQRPIEADFDNEGHLYVTDSSGSNEKVQKQLEDKPHRILRLEDTDGDGKFDKSIVFADKMMFPEGCMWYEGSLYVAAPPSIWKLTDTNGDGVADVRVEWFKGQTLTGCANDLHGPYAGPDGWIYWCKGAFAKQTYTLPNGKEFTTRASHIFRARPDGSGVEPVMTGGMDNPVGIAFLPSGEPILSGTFFQNPEGGKRDGLIHAVYGGVFGKVNDVLEGHTRTGDLLPMTTHLGPAAPCGIIYYGSSPHFESRWQGSLVVCNFNLHKVTRHVLIQTSVTNNSTFQTADTDLLVSDNPDFHPTDVLEDADGTLLVVDTGGWYKLCCPTSQLYKPDVLGGIYRIRRKGVPALNDPRGLKIVWPDKTPEELAKYLIDQRSVVRQRAVQELAHRGDAAVPVLAKRAGDVLSSAFAVYALTQSDSSRAREAVRDALKNPQDWTSEAAAHALSLWRDTGAFPQLVAQLRSTNSSARIAAEALGRIGDKRAVPELLAKAGEPIHRVFEHAIIYALIEIGDAAGTAVGLKSENPSTRRAALIALDQMPGGNLQPEQVVPLLASSNAVLKQTASWIVEHHADWGPSLAKYFDQQLSAARESQRTELEQQLEKFARSSAIQELLVKMLSSANGQTRVAALRALAKSGVKEIPAQWNAPLLACLQQKDPALLAASVATMRTLPAPKTNIDSLRDGLIALAERSDVPVTVRVAAAAAVPGGIRQLSEPLYDRLVNTVLDGSVTERANAAEALSHARLSNARLIELAGHLKRVGPMELPRLLPAFARNTNELVGSRLVDSLQASKAWQSLRAENVRPVLTNFPATVQSRAETLLASLNTDAAQQKKHVDELLESCKGGDVRRGQALFNSPKAACSACHAIGYLGGKVGPDLTRIGTVRNERDLLEAIVYPSASFVRSYEPLIVATKSGDEFNGVLKKDASDEIVLAIGPTTEQRIARNDIADMRPGTVSVMPSGLADQLTKEELADLLAFLKATKW